MKTATILYITLLVLGANAQFLKFFQSSKNSQGHSSHRSPPTNKNITTKNSSKKKQIITPFNKIKGNNNNQNLGKVQRGSKRGNEEIPTGNQSNQPPSGTNGNQQGMPSGDQNGQPPSGSNGNTQGMPNGDQSGQPPSSSSGTPPEMPNGNQNGQFPNGSSDQPSGTPPQMPNGNQNGQPPFGSDQPSGTPPEMPNGDQNGQPPSGSSNQGNNTIPTGQPPSGNPSDSTNGQTSNGNGVSNDDEDDPGNIGDYIKNSSNKLNTFAYLTLLLILAIVA